jgi:folliculin
LQELTGDKNVFQMLHVAFLWILKACGSRVTETLLEGPPTEDTIIDMEKQEETEEGFIKIFTRKIDEEDISGHDQIGMPAVMALGIEQQEDNDHHCPVIKNLRHLRKIVGSSNFLTLAHHVVLGNQVIVSGGQRPLVLSILNALKSLLPKGCCRVIPYSSTYQESWRCNFLGVSPDVSLVQLMNSSEVFVLLEILVRQQSAAERMAGLNCDVRKPDPEDLHFHDLEFKMSGTFLTHKVPTVLSRMVMALQNENLSLQVVDAAFTCLKEEWMNKVKVLFKFTKAGGNRSDDDTKRLLQIVGAREEDKLLLKFWMTGLSVQYKTHILASSVHR